MNKQVDNYVKHLKPAQQRIVRQLRELIKKTLPEIEEEYKWHVPYYSPVCYIAVHPAYVNLGFCFGDLLPHKYGYKIEGTGKHMRHVKIKRLADIKVRPLTHLMRDALEVYKRQA